VARTSEAEVQAVCSVRGCIHRIHGTDYRTDAVHARLVRHEKSEPRVNELRRIP
jgi:hypothetical protein